MAKAAARGSRKASKTSGTSLRTGKNTETVLIWSSRRTRKHIWPDTISPEPGNPRSHGPSRYGVLPPRTSSERRERPHHPELRRATRAVLQQSNFRPCLIREAPRLHRLSTARRHAIMGHRLYSLGLRSRQRSAGVGEKHLVEDEASGDMARLSDRGATIAIAQRRRFQTSIFGFHSGPSNQHDTCVFCSTSALRNMPRTRRISLVS